jgi:signal transduction histidine kinase
MRSMTESLQDLREYLLPLEGGIQTQDPAALLDIILRDMHEAVISNQINVQLLRRESLPMVRGDPERLRSALERVVRYCCSRNLRGGGDLAVEAGPKKIGEDLYAEVRITTSPSAPIEIEETKHFQPYLKVESERIELGLALAAEILKRYQGRVSVQRQSGHLGQVTILMKASHS